MAFDGDWRQPTTDYFETCGEWASMTREKARQELIKSLQELEAAELQGGCMADPSPDDDDLAAALRGRQP